MTHPLVTGTHLYPEKSVLHLVTKNLSPLHQVPEIVTPSEPRRVCARLIGGPIVSLHLLANWPTRPHRGRRCWWHLHSLQERQLAPPLRRPVVRLLDYRWEGRENPLKLKPPERGPYVWGAEQRGDLPVAPGHLDRPTRGPVWTRCAGRHYYL